MHYNLHLYSCLSSTPFIQCMVSVKVTVTHENNHILDKTFTLDIPMSNTFSYQTLTNFWVSLCFCFQTNLHEISFMKMTL